jgi:hypothetical protein
LFVIKLTEIATATAYKKHACPANFLYIHGTLFEDQGKERHCLMTVIPNCLLLRRHYVLFQLWMTSFRKDQL